MATATSERSETREREQRPGASGIDLTAATRQEKIDSQAALSPVVDPWEAIAASAPTWGNRGHHGERIELLVRIASLICIVGMFLAVGLLFYEFLGVLP